MNNLLPPPNAVLYYDFTRDPFCQKSLDLSMANKSFQNLLINPQMNDNNGDGLPDSWTTYNPSGISADYLIDDEYTKIELTESTTASTGAQLSQNITDIAPGQIFSCRCIARVSSPDVIARLQISYYTDAGYGGVIGNIATTTNEVDTVLSIENAIVPATAIRLQILLRLLPSVSGNIGTAWFKSPELIRHSTFTIPNKSARLYGPQWVPDGLLFDGIDDYCELENNADADITDVTPEKPLTISVVTKPLVEESMFILSKNYELASSYQYTLYYSGSSSNKRLQSIIHGLSSSYTPGVSLSVNEQIYYILSYDGIILKEYKNGVLTSSAPRTGSLTSRPYFYLGCKMNNPASGQKTLFYKGIISELYVGHAQPDQLIHWFARTGRFEKYGIAR
ncbi:hypothetical protein A7W90_16275 [Clostridium sp. Bc-iso-3]|nr:hypothetical protein A7W90_16275 [Clostridium sp. Bc-iso-3]